MAGKSCCGGPRPVVYKPGATRGSSKPGTGGPEARSIPESIEDGGIMANIPVEFIGTRKGSFTIYGGETKAPYRFSIHARVVLVDERDVPQMIANPGFRRYGQSGRPTPRPPEPRRGDPPNINTPITGPATGGVSTRAPVNAQGPSAAISSAQIAAKEAADLARRAANRDNREETDQPKPQRMIPRRDTMGTSKPNIKI